MGIKPVHVCYSFLISCALLLGAAGFCWAGALPLINLLLLTTFAGLLFVLRQHRPCRRAFRLPLWMLALVLGFAAAIYRPQDFHYPLVQEFGPLHEGGSPFSLYLNISKALGGYLVIAWCWRQLEGSGAPKRLWDWLVALGLAVLVIIVASTIFGLSFKPKLPDGFVYFVLVNLLVTVVAEEAFFRLLIQRSIAEVLSPPVLAVPISVLVTTMIFTLAHTTRLDSTFLLFFLVGFIYSAFYAYSGRLSSVIGLHFTVNLLHFLLLEYPIAR